MGIEELVVGSDTAPSNFLDAIKQDTEKSLRAAGMMVGLYKPSTDDERAELQQRFAADAALLGVTALTGGAAGVALKGVRPIARAILGGALSGGAGSGAFAAVEGEPIAPAVGFGAVLGAVPGAIGGGMKAAAKAGATKAATTLSELDKLRTVGPRVLAQDRTPPASQKGLDPFSLPLRTVDEERMIDPFSIPHTPEDVLEELRMNDAVRGVLSDTPTGVSLPVRPTDSPALAKEGKRTALEAFQEFVAAQQAGKPNLKILQTARKEARIGGVTRERIVSQGYTPALKVGDEVRTGTSHSEIWLKGMEELSERKDVVSGFVREGKFLTESEALNTVRAQGRGGRSKLGPITRRGRPVVDDAAVFLNGPPEAANMAIANSAVRRTLMKLPHGEDVLKLYNDGANLIRRTVVSAGSALSKMGPAGAELGTRMSTALDRAAMAAGQDVVKLNAVLKPLSQKERFNVSHVLNGDELPLNSRVAEAAQTAREVLDNMAERAKQSGLQVIDPLTGKVRPFEARANYFPLEYSEKTIKKYMAPGPEREEALRLIIQSQQAMSREEAEAVLNRYLRPHINEFRFGHLQVARHLALPGWEADPLKVLPQYLLKGHKRVETALAFGADDALAYRLFEQIGKTGYDDKFALDVYQAFTDRNPPKLRELAKATRTLNILSLLSTAGIVQLSQHTNTIALTGYKNYLQGLATFLSRSKPSREFAGRTGAYMQEMIQDLVPLSGVDDWWDKMARGWLQGIGLTPLDKANRIVAAFAGMFHADDIALKYAKEQTPALARQLTRIGISPDDVLKQQGVLTAQQRLTGAQQASLLTQFRGSVLDLPIAKHSTAGQFVYLFKTFAFQQARFVASLMEEGTKHGNWAPMTRYLSATGLLTYPVGQTLMAVKYGTDEIPGLQPLENKPDREGLLGALELTAQAGSLGIAYDALRGMFHGPQWLTSLLIGPTATDTIALLGRDVPEALRGNPQQALHDAIKHIPLLGRRVADHLVPLE